MIKFDIKTLKFNEYINAKIISSVPNQNKTSGNLYKTNPT